MSYVLGLDMGTSYTAAAIGRPGKVSIVNLSTTDELLPSVVAVTDGGEYLVGAKADHSPLPARQVARSFKRVLGDPVLLTLGTQRVMPEQLVAHVLEAAVRRAAEHEGEAPSLVVVTHPSGYGPFKKDLLDEACLSAGMNNILFLSEAEAAVIYEASKNPIEVGQSIAVYDFGGGLFNAAVVRRTQKGLELLGTPESITRLGGVDFDGVVASLVDTQLEGRIGQLDLRDPETAAAHGVFLRACRAAKEALSDADSIPVSVRLPGATGDVEVNRYEFEKAIRSRVLETVMSLQRTVVSAGLRPDEIDRVLLMGGSSRIPLVERLVSDTFGRTLRSEANRKLGVAIGAAMMGREDRSRFGTFARLAEAAAGGILVGAGAGDASGDRRSNPRGTLVGVAAASVIGVLAWVVGQGSVSPPGTAVPTTAAASVAAAVVVAGPSTTAAEFTSTTLPPISTLPPPTTAPAPNTSASPSPSASAPPAPAPAPGTTPTPTVTTRRPNTTPTTSAPVEIEESTTTTTTRQERTEGTDPPTNVTVPRPPPTLASTSSTLPAPTTAPSTTVAPTTTVPPTTAPPTTVAPTTTAAATTTAPTTTRPPATVASTTSTTASTTTTAAR